MIVLFMYGYGDILSKSKSYDFNRLHIAMIQFNQFIYYQYPTLHFTANES